MNYTIYHLFDYETRHYIGKEFSDIVEFFEYHYKYSFNNAKPYWWLFGKYFDHQESLMYCPDRICGRYTIKDAYGSTYKNPAKLYFLAKQQGLNLFPHKPYISSPIKKVKKDIPKNNINKLKYNYHYYNWVRQIKTTNERRQNAIHESEYGGIVRPSRKKKNLPDSFCDRANGLWKKKSWKDRTKRKSQWKFNDK